MTTTKSQTDEAARQSSGFVASRSMLTRRCFGGERCLHPAKEWDEKRIVARRLQVLEVDVDPLETIRKAPTLKPEDRVLLQGRVVQKRVDPLRIELACTVRRQLGVAEDGHDVEIVGVRDVQHIEVVRGQERVPVVKIEPPGIGAEVNPDRQQVCHLVGVGRQRVKAGLLPRRIERRDDALAGLDRANGAFGLARTTVLVVLADPGEEAFPVAFEQVLRSRPAGVPECAGLA